MNYRPWLEPSALRQMGGLPDDGLDELVSTTASICTEPYDRLHSVPVRADNPAERMAELGDNGFIEFTVDEAEGLIRIYSIVWLG